MGQLKKRLMLGLINRSPMLRKAFGLYQSAHKTEEERLGQMSFSQEGEDILLKRIMFGEGNWKGYYVDVGAHHPIRFSNTLLLHQLGWKGINIDALPEAIEAFEKHRPGDINLNIGVSDTEGELYYYKFKGSALNTFDESKAEKVQENRPLLEKVLVPVASLSKLLNEHLPEGQQIDLMNIDVENLEMKVLAGNDWVRFAPNKIIIEFFSSSVEDALNNPAYHFLKEKGYTYLCKFKNSHLFVRPS